MATHVKGGKNMQLRAIGVIYSPLKSRPKAPKQSAEGAPDAWLEVSSFAAQGHDRSLPALKRAPGRTIRTAPFPQVPAVTTRLTLAPVSCI